jgi:hypothetical protein
MLKKFVHAVDAVNNFVGRYTALLLIPLVAIVFYEVFMRKLFNMPTIWVFETTVYLYGFHYMMSMGVTMLYDKHVRIDIITLQLPEKIQLILRLITFWIIFVPFRGGHALGRHGIRGQVLDAVGAQLERLEAAALPFQDRDPGVPLPALHPRVRQLHP